VREDGEIRVNQSGSVALSAEEVRVPPWHDLLIVMALLTQRKSYELGGRWYPYLGPPEATKPVILRGWINPSQAKKPEIWRKYYPPYWPRSLTGAAFRAVTARTV